MREREKVSLWLRIKTADGKRPYCRPVHKKNGWAVVNGKRECHLQDGVYHLRYEIEGKRIWEPVGRSYLFADAQRNIRAGELSLNQVSGATKTPARLTLADLKLKFMELKELAKKSDGTRLDKETVSAYEQQTTEFLGVLGKKMYADEIDGMDLRRYMSALEKRGLTHRTICNNYTGIASFLKFCAIDHKDLLPKGERPTPHDGEPEAYTQAEIIRFLGAITRERDRIAFEFLLKVGAREREMTNACWTDIAGGATPVFKIQNHPELDFRTKTGKSRVVPLERGLYERLMLWREKNPTTKLIFGTRKDRVDTHFLEVCKATAKKANLPGNWYLHKFRSTFATWALRAGVDLRTVQGWMGHSSIAMTERYLEPGTGKVVQDKLNAAFGVILITEANQDVTTIM
jgi:integrase/recombinase XerD